MATAHPAPIAKYFMADFIEKSKSPTSTGALLISKPHVMVKPAYIYSTTVVKTNLLVLLHTAS